MRKHQVGRNLFHCLFVITRDNHALLTIQKPLGCVLLHKLFPTEKGLIYYVIVQLGILHTLIHEITELD